MKAENKTTKQGRRKDSQNDNNLEQHQDNEEGAVGDVSASTNATIQDHHEVYLAWWKTCWELLDIL